jgi:hypothetical protein
MRAALQFAAGLTLALAITCAAWTAVRMRDAARVPAVRCVGDARAEGLVF